MVLWNCFKSVGLFADLVPVFMVSLVTKTQVSAHHLMNKNKIYGGNLWLFWVTSLKKLENVVHSLPSQSQALEVSGDVQPTLLTAFDSPLCTLWIKQQTGPLNANIHAQELLGLPAESCFL